MIHNIDKNGKKSSKNNSGRMKKYLQNYYQMDKPWVTDIIREKFKKKEELYDKLKGRQDAKLFAEFKLTKNEFAKLYKEARTKFEEGTLSKVIKFSSIGIINYNIIIFSSFIFRIIKQYQTKIQMSRTRYRNLKLNLILIRIQPKTTH